MNKTNEGSESITDRVKKEYNKKPGRKLKKDVKSFFNSLFADLFIILLIYLAYEFKLEYTFNLIDLDYLDVFIVYFIIKIVLK